MGWAWVAGQWSRRAMSGRLSMRHSPFQTARQLYHDPGRNALAMSGESRNLKRTRFWGEAFFSAPLEAEEVRYAACFPRLLLIAGLDRVRRTLDPVAR